MQRSGGGVYNKGLDVSITNSTFFANSAGDGGGGIYNGLNDPFPTMTCDFN